VLLESFFQLRRLRGLRRLFAGLHRLLFSPVDVLQSLIECVVERLLCGHG
jgi:hypothetical protein